jgi:hypothetical protein
MHQRCQSDAADLLTRQDTLQAEAHTVLADLDLVRLLEAVGRPVLVGSAALGLMVWRDIDFNVMCDELDVDRIFTAVRPLAVHPGIYRLRFANEFGPFNPTGQPEDDGYYWGVHYFAGGTLAGNRWKIDLWFLPEGSPRPEVTLIERCARELTPETRLAILRIKDEWYQHPAYRHTVLSVDIYAAVLDHGVRTPAAFASYLAARGTLAP